MATLCLFHTNLPFPSSCKPYRTRFCRLFLHKQNWPPDTLTRLKRLHISASSINKPRISRNRRVVKSNDELCSEIRLFFDQVGLPQDHIPSMKDFMQHGRNDLANIVRRRGYKLIRELLESSGKVEASAVDTNKRLDGFDAQEKIDAGQDDDVTKIDEHTTSEITCEMVPLDSGDHETLKGQDEKINVVTEEDVYSIQIAKADGNSDGSEEVSELDCCNPSYELLEDVDSSYHDENTSGGPECDDQEDEVSLSSIIPLRRESSYLSNSSSYLQPYNEDSELTKLTAGLSLEQQLSSKSEGRDARDNAGSEDEQLNTEISSAKDLSHSLVMDSINKTSSEEIMGMNSSADLSLEEKVAKFVQDGDLAALEGGHELIEAEAVDISSKVSGAEQTKKQFSDDVLIGSNGIIASSRDPVPYAKANNVLKDNNVAAEGHSTNSDKDLDNEQDEQQISHLKLMLHEKELEFSRLKELIEKEKLALSVLQTVAETEINQAQKLVSEKDAELHAAEECLSGLTEVQIQFCGDGDIVEVTGSFNGWQHMIKMDLDPSAASVTDASGSRKSKLWTTVLWLYPGVYEIKFIVDGHWRIDPQKESVTRGHVCNNILLVGR